MKLEYIEVDGYGILVNNEVINKDDYFYVKTMNISGGNIIKKSLGYGKNAWNQNILADNTTEQGYHKNHCTKILFAEKELNLDIPVFEWRNWEIEGLALIATLSDGGWVSNEGKLDVAYEYFLRGYKANQAKFTIENLKNAWELSAAYGTAEDGILPEALQAQKSFLKSLIKKPKFIVMENNLIKEIL